MINSPCLRLCSTRRLQKHLPSIRCGLRHQAAAAGNDAAPSHCCIPPGAAERVPCCRRTSAISPTSVHAFTAYLTGRHGSHVTLIISGYLYLLLRRAVEHLWSAFSRICLSRVHNSCGCDAFKSSASLARSYVAFLIDVDACRVQIIVTDAAGVMTRVELLMKLHRRITRYHLPCGITLLLPIPHK